MSSPPSPLWDDCCSFCPAGDSTMLQTDPHHDGIASINDGSDRSNPTRMTPCLGHGTKSGGCHALLGSAPIPARQSACAVCLSRAPLLLKACSASISNGRCIVGGRGACLRLRCAVLVPFCGNIEVDISELLARNIGLAKVARIR